jgi:hypothetical protein
MDRARDAVPGGPAASRVVSEVTGNRSGAQAGGGGVGPSAAPERRGTSRVAGYLTDGKCLFNVTAHGENAL